MSVAVKTYFNFTDDEPEIRRFSVDTDASTSFDYLVGKVRDVYPSLKRADIQLYWRDEDKEFITFSTDEELIEALTHVNGEFFRVYVKEKPCSGTKSSEKGQVHPHVSCDECNGKVVGSRFKCMVCPDYDLCSTCESAGLHSHHYLIRIRTPGTAPRIPWFMDMPFLRGRHMGRGGCGGRRGGPWGWPFHGSRRGRGACHGYPAGPPAGGPSHCPPSDGGSRCFPRGPPGGEPSGCPPKDGEPPMGTEEPNQPGGAYEPAAFFHQFGEVLNSFLGPFGVDVHTYVDSNQGEPGKCGQHKEQSTCPTPPNPDNTEGETSTCQKEKSTSEEPMEEASSPHNGDHTYVVVGNPEHDGSSPQPDKALTDAIAQMKTMGFDDENGWLTQLLKAKNCDINKALDAIHNPSTKQ